MLMRGVLAGHSLLFHDDDDEDKRIVAYLSFTVRRVALISSVQLHPAHFG